MIESQTATVADAAAAGQHGFDACFPGTAQVAAMWALRQREAVAAGGYLGSDWGDDAYVDDFADRFLLGYVDRASTVLELGPGGGRYTERVLPAVAALDAVDVAPDILAFLRARLGHAGELRTIAGSGRTLRGLPLRRYDLVFAANLFPFLELENAFTYLRDIGEVLTEDGVAVVQYADFSNQVGRRHLLAHLDAWNQHLRTWFKFHYLCKALVEQMLAELGLRVLRHASHHRDSVVVFARKASRRRPRWGAVAPELERGPRRAALPARMDADEQAWWRRQGELDRELHRHSRLRDAWVSDLRYLRAVTGSLPEAATVVDFGCGDGWVAQQLARAGAARVVGVDFAPTQIGTARATLPPDLADRVSFVLGSDLPADLRADVVVCHAVLHHLSWHEIARALDAIDDVLTEDGTVWLLEPVRGRGDHRGWRALPRLLRALFTPWRGRRPMAAAERELRRQLEQHLYAPRLPMHGPSPKELPFEIGELERALAGRFEVMEAERVFLDAHQVTAELQLFAVSFPRLARMLRRPVRWLAGTWERWALRRCRGELWQGWVFTLFRLRRCRGEVAAAGPAVTLPAVARVTLPRPDAGCSVPAAAPTR